MVSFSCAVACLHTFYPRALLPALRLPHCILPYHTLPLPCHALPIRLFWLHADMAAKGETTCRRVLGVCCAVSAGSRCAATTWVAA